MSASRLHGRRQPVGTSGGHSNAQGGSEATECQPLVCMEAGNQSGPVVDIAMLKKSMT